VLLVSLYFEGILSETRRGAGSGASPWKQVKFQKELPEGFPERLRAGKGQPQGRRFRPRGGELSGFNTLFLLLACMWVIRIFHILTKKVMSSMSDDPDEL
jgi:hypothetical protein